MIPNSPTPISVMIRLDTVNARKRKKPSGIMGSAVRASQATKTANSTAEAIRKLSVYAESQGWLVVLIRPQVSRNRALVTSTVPTMSSVRALGSRDSITAHRVTPVAITPTGTLTQNTADHE